ncbi:nucleocapsid protein [Scophthalmus maximus rhabdovirus]|uniref:Nucleoprotein n=1 Tax=Scophthalmus maximus rhabdovirus TaxID=936149 RepID=E7D0U0_9RHAB|nr:nucleocapsid protein [Scophthalmus maximus rhabdovirus]ADU05400.1 nucleocapsid protein [Scophthalmus maximus rhabdovirus]
MKRANTTRIVENLDLGASSRPEYPSKFFANKKKPSISLRLATTDAQLDAMRAYIKSNLKRGDGQLGVEDVKAYVASVMMKQKEQADTKWESFGLVIADAGVEITIANLFEVTTLKWKDAPVATETATAEDDIWMVLTLLGLARISENTQYDAYADKLAANLGNLIKARTNGKEKCPSYARFSGWTRDRDFMKLVAGIDMFYHHFPKSEWAQIRFGTITSRYKDCAIISSLEHLRKTTALSPKQLQGWILTDAAADEYEQVMKPDEEIEKGDSYTPYLSDMCLSARSPYSATACAALHLWVHMTCIYLSSERSKNARIPLETAMVTIQTNAALMGYALKSRAVLVQAFVDTTAAPQSASGPSSAPSISPNVHGNPRAAEPESVDGDDWLSYLQDEGGRLPDVIVKHCNAITQRILTDRAASLGAWMRDHPL